MSNNSQSHSSQSSSRDCTPDPNHDYTATQKELILLCTPSKSDNELAQLRSRLAASVDDHGRVVSVTDSHASNAASTTGRTSPTILASVAAVRATTAPRMTTYHLKGAREWFASAFMGDDDNQGGDNQCEDSDE
ncbi:hypothetical protein C8J57DRAFT_1727615 [Mycena rebaudengoi]|nr:hypothetical protein C8J57DRAFT_1727615 [Mycena rebaudengoi]